MAGPATARWQDFRLLVLALCAATALTTGGMALAPVRERFPTYAVTTVVAATSLILLGWIATGHRRSRSSGMHLMVGGASWPACWWGVSQAGIGPFAGLVASQVFWSVMILAVLSYPGDHPWTRSERIIVPALIAWLNVGQIVSYVVSRPEWNGFPAESWWPSVAPTEPVFEVVSVVYGVSLLSIAFVVVAMVLRRFRRASGLDRRALLPAAAGVGVGAIAGGVGAAAQAYARSTEFWAGTLYMQGLGLLVVPASMAVSELRRRLARGGVVDMVVQLNRALSIESVRAALRAALRDDTVEVLFWVPERNGYVDSAGRPAPPPSTSQGRMVMPVSAGDGSALALVVADAQLEHHADLVDGAISAARLALENARLQAVLRAQLEEVRSSRARILEVQQDERRRLERDLHDGAQQRLLAVSMALGLARESTTDDGTRAVVDEARTELRVALEELRNLARGLHPAVLSQSGLAAAVEGMVERSPVPVTLEIPEQRWSPAAEATAYFFVSEALANVAKHAPGARVLVAVVEDGSDLVVTVQDDGPGGAGMDEGGGLVGLSDRVRGLGGSLRVDSERGSGTTLVARIPCG